MDIRINHSTHLDRRIGTLLISGAFAVMVPYTLLTLTFAYPDILRMETGVILTRFYEGGPELIFTWFAFGISGVLLLEAYVLIGERLTGTFYYIRWATLLAIISGVTQIVGLLRWTFVVPVLANNYVHAQDEAVMAANVAAFELVHQFAGVLMGEHIGQLTTIAWTVMISLAFRKLKIVPSWVCYFAFAASLIYLMAQAELFATVVPGFPVWDLAGFLGSTLWLIWLVMLGICFVRSGNSGSPVHSNQ